MPKNTHIGLDEGSSAGGLLRGRSTDTLGQDAPTELNPPLSRSVPCTIA
jgi:hypothetical protein